ncbi:penicillin-binding protein 1C [Pseudaminobacter arsenicus]|uniref:peptidoglycan glycosyltransferase n=1 Tax=Borborobacter arsenicus TaxID=1851146 RepID=A0A432VCD5_9HYPH|nr:penicillin-binding protein 1C [Pseudaminobacter arsenicus]RUM99837.1 penicillin-binding protein 1C [Pseudaminobacter arsenicus]
MKGFSHTALHRLAVGAGTVLACLVLAISALLALDRTFPPPLPKQLTVSTEVLDRDGALLRAYATPDGYWRLDTHLDAVDPQFVKMLVAYEDKRFFEHSGVDVLALLRAARQFAFNGRIVSGGSTLSMQLARLIEPRESRSIWAKVRQIARAIQIERRLSKHEILERYLTLAPYGGNLEGVRAASLAYFGKEPRRLTMSESALLVALPQLPERRRPDRNRGGAEAARDRVLKRMVSAGLFGEREAARAAAEEVAGTRFALPALAPHAADRALRNAPSQQSHQLTLSRRVQEGLEAVARASAAKLGSKISVAMVLADARSGEVLGEVGSADYFDAARSGWIDMTRASRSPGSTLKSFIYGLAIEQGLVAQETMIEDRPADFAGYRPRNFDMSYQGDVTVRQALQLSLNVPAVRLLDAVGPARLTSRFRQAGVIPSLPKDEPPGLAIGLGGVGLSLRDLVQLYTGLANSGKATRLRDGTEAEPPAQGGGLILDDRATWQVADMLAGVRPPEGASRRGVAYKTGTSYGYRDAWSIGFDGRHVLGVWVGRADSGSVPGLSGYVSAAPILFKAFTRSGLAAVPLPRAPAGTLHTAQADLPVTLQRFTSGSDGLVTVAPTEPAPQIVFPPDGAHVELSPASAKASPLVLKLQGGRAPFRWLANGKPLTEPLRRRTATWQPDGAGYSTLTVIDAAGRAASVKIFVE